MNKTGRSKTTKNGVSVNASEKAQKGQSIVQSKTSVREGSGAAKDFPIVGIGASAGGLEAFTLLLENLPAETGMAFIFIQHLASGESMLTDILSRSTTMPVQTVKNDMTVEPNNVYVIPPDANVSISSNTLLLKKRASKQYRPIDEFLVALAQEKKSLSVGVILSGTGTDGTEGLKAVYAEGGITFAQDEETAKYAGMPQSAATSGIVAFILPPKKIAEELAVIGRHPRLNHVESVTIEKPEAMPEANDLKAILSLLKLTFHVDFNNYKPTTVNRRISRRMVIHKIESLSDYVKLLRTDTTELRSLFDDMLINVTSFFREPETFQLLNDRILPEIMKDKSPETTIRVWVPGCASGEEAYSIAICLREYFEKTGTTSPVTIFGTDVNNRNVEKARAGVYPESIVAEVSEARLGRFFAKVDQGFQIVKPVRDMCIFATQDMTKDPPFSNLDIVSCRNVLIYFKPELQHKILPAFHYALKPNRFLVLGISESIGAFEDLFAPIENTKGPVYIRRVGPAKVTFAAEPSFELMRGEILKRPIPEKPLIVTQRDVDQILMSKYVPPSVVVDEAMNILIFRGDTGPFLSPTPGEASFNLIKMVKNELRIELQTSIYSARKQKKSVRREGLEFHSNGETKRINIEVIPLKGPESESRLFMVTFEPATSMLSIEERLPQRGRGAEEKARAIKENQLKEMANELASTKESLQSIIEEQESTNEELRSALEEVQSSNEELQSTNEELETAKEELQSTNEELNTLNEELAKRNKEINRTANDLNNVFNNTNIAIIILDVGSKIRLFTPIAEKLFNLIPSDTNRPLSDMRLAIKVPNLQKTIRCVMEDLVPMEQDVQAENGNWYLMRVRPYLTLDKKIDGVVLSFVNITEMKQTEAKLEALVRERTSELAETNESLQKEIAERKRSEEKLRSSLLYSRGLIESSLDPLITINSEGKITDVNKSTEAVTGFPREELIGTDFSAYFTEPEKAKAGYQEVFVKGQVRDYHLAIRHRSGKITEVLYNATLYRNEKGEVQGVFAAARDITERKKAEEKVQEQADLLNIARDAILVRDLENKITFWNKGAELLYGWTAQEAIGKKANELLHKGDSPTYQEAYKEVLATGEWMGELSQVRKNGDEVIVQSRWGLMRDAFGKPKSILVIHTDMTEKKKLEAEILRTQRMATIGETAGMVGHDIRNPLQSIIGDLYLLRSTVSSMPESPKRAEIIEDLDTIDENIEYINKIIQDLQDYAAQIKPQLKETSVKAICEEVLVKNHVPDNVVASCKVETEAERIVTDPGLLKRILNNLVSNAVQAMPDGGKLQINAFRQENSTTIVVSDTGVGVPKEFKSRLFTPLFTTKSKGQGFGLPVVKRITEALDGVVTYESEIGKGTNFILRFPTQGNKP